MPGRDFVVGVLLYEKVEILDDLRKPLGAVGYRLSINYGFNEYATKSYGSVQFYLRDYVCEEHRIRDAIIVRGDMCKRFVSYFKNPNTAVLDNGMCNSWFVNYIHGVCKFPLRDSNPPDAITDNLPWKVALLKKGEDFLLGDCVVFYGLRSNGRKVLHKAIYLTRGYFLSKMSTNTELICSTEDQLITFVGKLVTVELYRIDKEDIKKWKLENYRM